MKTADAGTDHAPEAHYFDGRHPHLGPGERRCKVCRLSYDDGDHIEITTLKPYTSYVCPTGGGTGHSGIWTGALLHSLRTLTQHLCVCGEAFVEEDKETWRLTWEMQDSAGTPWRTVTAIRTKHQAISQREGLTQLIAQGEPIRNVSLEQLVALEGSY